jgi:hypothetical protein
MDSIFDEDVDEVGGEIEAYCPSSRCKADTTHTIISMYEDEVRRVQCVVCGDVHAYRKPRGDAYEDVAEPPLRKRLSHKPSWEEAMARVTESELAKARPYSIRDTYEEMDVVSHPTFDVGFVTELLPDNKVEVTFKDERRILVHNRGDLSERMPSIAAIPAPREEKKRKRRKKKAAAPPPPPVVQGNEDMDPEELQKALEQAEAARKVAAEKAATEKRKLSKRLAVEQIRAKRAHLDDEAPARGKTRAKGSARATSAKVAPARQEAAARTVKKGAKMTVVLPAAGTSSRTPARPAAAPSRGGGAKKGVKPAARGTFEPSGKSSAQNAAAKKPAAKKPAATSAARNPAAKKPAAKTAAKKPAAKSAAKKPAATSAAKKPAVRTAARSPAAKKPAARKPAPKKAAGRAAPGRKRSTPRRKS